MNQPTRIALVTGAGAGIGRAIVQELAQTCSIVVAADLNVAAAEETAALVRAAGAESIGMHIDVTSEDSVAGAFREVEARWGRLDILVNNAGIARVAHILNMTLEDFR